MGYRVLADATMVVHFAFLAYVVAGGFLAWFWLRAIWPHLVFAGWGLVTVVYHLNCPLTFLEDWARRRAGGPGLTTGFIDHYLTGVVYPERYAAVVRLLAAAAVVVSWVGAWIRWRGRGHTVITRPGTHHPPLSEDHRSPKHDPTGRRARSGARRAGGAPDPEALASRRSGRWLT
jgi:hypothetical protein